MPLLRRAYELWRDLEAVAGEQLLHITGSLDAGPPDSFVFEGSAAPASSTASSTRCSTGTEVTGAFPGLPACPAGLDGGAPAGRRLSPARALHRRAASSRRGRRAPRSGERAGAGVGGDERRRPRDAPTAATTRGRLVLTAGAWEGELIRPSDRRPSARCSRWLDPLRPELFAPERFPVFNVSVEEGRYYGFPVYGIPGFKFGRYHHLGARRPRRARPRAGPDGRAAAARASPSATSPMAQARRRR